MRHYGCLYVWQGEVSSRYNERMKDLRGQQCKSPYFCPTRSQVLTCMKPGVMKNSNSTERFFGRYPYPGGLGYPEFAWTLEGDVVVRDGVELHPAEEYIDENTQKVELILSFFVPSVQVKRPEPSSATHMQCSSQSPCLLAMPSKFCLSSDRKQHRNQSSQLQSLLAESHACGANCFSCYGNHSAWNLLSAPAQNLFMKYVTQSATHLQLHRWPLYCWHPLIQHQSECHLIWITSKSS